ncbi:MAG TPA: glycosyltransferase family 87 protein [Chloroflexia bacterium]|nr:glycosyltransferase family 87 protein [Chloroflexia bacterium]
MKPPRLHLELDGTRRRTLLAVALLALLLFTWGQLIAQVFWPAAFQDGWRRTGIWVGARLAIEGQGAMLYDAGAFRSASIRLGAVPDIFDPNSPATILLYLPIAGLDVHTARTLWICASLAFFILAWALLLRALRLPPLVALALSAAVPLFQPWRANIRTGQDYAAALLFIVAGALFSLRAEPPNGDASRSGRGMGSFAAGCSLGFAILMRQFYGTVHLLPALVYRQWKSVGAAVGVYGTAVLITLVWFGPGVWGTSLNLITTWRERPETAVNAYQSLNNFLTHLFRYHPQWNPGPILDAPWLVGPLWWTLAGLLVAVSVYTIWRTRNIGEGSASAQRLLPYALATPLALLISPISEDYHHTLAVFPLAVVAGVLVQLWSLERAEMGEKRPGYGRAVIPWLVLVLAAVLLGIPWRYYSAGGNLPEAEGWRAFLYYPRFYGNLLLWGLIVMLSNLYHTAPAFSKFTPGVQMLDPKSEHLQL